MISAERKFLFIHIPKTGGNAIRLALRDYADDEIVFNEKQQAYNESQAGVHRFGIRNPYMELRKHATLAEIHSNWNEQALGAWDQFFKFACVRNPWDRLISLYFSPHLGNTSFDEGKFRELIKNTKKGEQSIYVVENGRLATDFLIRFENLSEDFAGVCEKLGIDAQLPHVNQSKRGAYQEYYSNKTKKIVYKLYRRDIDLFGYEFDS